MLEVNVADDDLGRVIGRERPDRQRDPHVVRAAATARTPRDGRDPGRGLVPAHRRLHALPRVVRVVLGDSATFERASSRLRAALLQLPRHDAAERRPGRRLALRRRRRDGDAGRRRRRRAAGRLRRRAARAGGSSCWRRRAGLLDDALAAELAAEPQLALLCGRYEGVDERVREHLADDAVSIGRYVLAGGELAAMVVADAVLRKLPGALGHADSAVEESFSAALEGAPEYPHYTRPATYRGWDVPEVLLSGRPRAGPRVAAGRAAARRRGRLR